jgi:hypothetical protein
MFGRSFSHRHDCELISPPKARLIFSVLFLKNDGSSCREAQCAEMALPCSLYTVHLGGKKGTPLSRAGSFADELGNRENSRWMVLGAVFRHKRGWPSSRSRVAHEVRYWEEPRSHNRTKKVAKLLSVSESASRTTEKAGK